MALTTSSEKNPKSLGVSSFYYAPENKTLILILKYLTTNERNLELCISWIGVALFLR